MPEYSVCIWISGFTAKPKDLDAVVHAVQEKHPDVSVQFVDLAKVPGSRYLFLATLNALKSFRSKPISKSLGMEILLYAAASRQISEAIRLVGMTQATEKISVVLVAKTEREVSEAAELLSRIIRQQGKDELLESWSAERVRNV